MTQYINAICVLIFCVVIAIFYFSINDGVEDGTRHDPVDKVSATINQDELKNQINNLIDEVEAEQINDSKTMAENTAKQILQDQLIARIDRLIVKIYNQKLHKYTISVYNMGLASDLNEHLISEWQKEWDKNIPAARKELIEKISAMNAEQREEYFINTALEMNR